MIKWKQRLYAFLLRRVLGPFLDAASQQKLHDSIEVSFHEGIFTLNQVGLNTTYLNTLLLVAQQSSSGSGSRAPFLRIRNARIASISIQLSLLEGQEAMPASSSNEAMSPMAPSSYTSLARKAMNLGTAAVALVANVEIDGIQLEVEPIPRDQHTHPPEISSPARSPSPSSSSGSAVEGEPVAPKGYLASYMEAALSSLQLTLNLTNFSVRICEPVVTALQETTAWVEVRLPSLSYQDMDTNNKSNVTASLTADAPIHSQSSTSAEHPPVSPPSSSSSYRTILEKSVTFQGITIAAGETTRTLDQDDDGSTSSHSSDSNRMVESSSLVSVIALAEGTGHISVRAVEYGSIHASKTKRQSRAKPALPQVQQDIDIRLNQQIKVSVDETSIVQLKRILEGFQSMSTMSNNVQDGNSSTASQDATTTHRPLQRGNSVVSSTSGPSLNSINSRDDEMELYTITGMMKQYNEAKALAEQNQMRGGILLPSNAYEEGENVGVGDSRTFDVFFDANEKSFHHYASMMKSSILASQEAGLASDFVHTKLRFHLLGGGMKLSFQNRSNTSESLVRPDEYILMTFNDIDITSQVSGKRADYALHVSHLEIDDAHIPQSEVNSLDTGRVEIGSLLTFAQAFDDANGGDILVEPSCISLHLSIDSEVEGDRRCCDFELGVKPIELVYRHGTIAHITALAATLGDKGGNNSESSGRTLHMKDSVVSNDSQDNNQLRVNSALCTVGSLTVSFPVFEQRDFSPLYTRCGYKIGECHANQSALGLTLDHLTVEHRRRGGKTGESSAEPEMTTSLECHSVICFASSPEKYGSLAGRTSQRIDIVTATGRCEVDPCIPIAVEYRRNLRGETDVANFGTETFPTVPAFTSFKARQEDEDEDAEIDRILSQKLRDVNVDSRRALRAKDPQSEMLEEAGNCDAVIMVHIPGVLADVSREELETLLDMMHCILPTKQNSPESSKVSPASPSPSLSISLACDSIALSFHNLELSQEKRWNSHHLRFDRCRAHTISGGSSMKFIRFLSHETTLYENRGTSKTSATPYSVQNKLANMQNRSQRTKSSTTVPIFYRSKLFPALSQGSPSILLDYIQPTSANEGSFDSASESEQSVFLSIYNMTHRYDPNSEWLDRLQATFKDLNLKGNNSSQEPNNQAGETSTSPSSSACLTRVYLSLADCNLDYTSLRYFKISSRSILRIGDLRLSSNIMTPSVANQAFSLSIGDISWYLCNTRCPHNLENAFLPNAQAMFPPTDISSRPLDQSEPQLNSRTETVFREMGFKTILTLESVDAILAKKNIKDFDSITGARPGTQEPQLTISLTLGELSLYACKDSFQCFTETIGELQTSLTALTNEDLRELTKIAPKTLAEPAKEAKVPKNGNLQAIPIDRTNDLLLDGYDWTTIEHDSNNAVAIPPGQEQTARWYGSPKISVENADGDCVIDGDAEHETIAGPRLIHHHFPLEVVSNPLQGGDMDSAKFAGTERVSVNTRILLHDMKVKVRLFDGYDWPDFQVQRKTNPNALFVIDEAPLNFNANDASAAGEKPGSSEQKPGRKAELMGDLLAGAPDNSGTFRNMPLPEERVKIFLTQKELRRLSRRTNSYVQFSAQGVSLRLDSYCDSTEHRLKSCLDLSLKDFFLAETISNSTPIKMIGEWFNEVEHPRDSKDGLLMFKMVTWAPPHPLTANNELASDECEVALTLAPVRCILDQRAIKFKKAFFNNTNNGEADPSTDWTSGLNTLPPPMLLLFRVKPVKMKIDYSPQKIDTTALKNGSVVELINLSPLDAMVLLLHQVEIEDSLGFGEAMGSLVSHWLGDICATQMHKFLTNARPFEPFTNVGGGVSDLLVLPWDAYKSGESVSRALKSSISSLVGTVAHETLTTSSRITGFIAGEMAKATTSPSSAYNTTSSASSNSSLPSRPLGTPRRVGDTANHALESLARGAQTANYKVIIVPYREYRRSGTKGAVKSIVKGIPIAVAAPVSGFSEALSYTLLGARNQIRPDIRKEEEASQRGLHYGGV